jgi:CheY-like chemotaxis protein
VTGAANGREALDRLNAALEPHVVLLDLVMPVLDGVGMLRAVQADPAMAAAGHQVIIMSSTPKHVAAGIPPVYPWLAKPFTAAQLVAAVETALAG